MSGVEDIDGMEEVRSALEWADARRISVSIIRHWLTTPHQHCWQWGLVAVHTGANMRLNTPDIPRGWTTRRVFERDCVLILPLWLAWPRDLWRARWAVFRLAIRLGLWTVPIEGDYYTNGHLTAPLWLRKVVWCFLHDTDEVGYGGPGRPRFSDRPIAGAPFYGLTPRQYEAKKVYIHGVGWRHPNDPVTDADLRAMGWDV